MHSSNAFRHSLATSATVGIGELKVVRLPSSLAMMIALQKRKRYDFRGLAIVFLLGLDT